MKIKYTTQFKKDFKKIKKQNKDISKFQTVLEILTHQSPMPAKYKDHALIGNWSNHRECHVEPDWLLIYRVTDSTLYLERMGSHSQLFKR